MARKKLLFAVGIGGPPLEHTLPRLERCADVHALLLAPITGHPRELLDEYCASILDRSDADGVDAAKEIVAACREIGASGVITFSEFAISSVAQACMELGLPGPGPNVGYARDKFMMRTRWRQAGVPVPRFRRVAGLSELTEARNELAPPFLLKPSGRGGAIGQQIINSDTDLRMAWDKVEQALGRAASSGIVEYGDDLDVTHCVAEELIDSTTDSWYDIPGFGDYLSVEGIVARGEYHPIAITSRLPTIPPFIETSTQSPCVLPEGLQRIVEKHARNAVDALGLETCATHTEMKLMAGNKVCLLESAARMAGVNVAAQVEDVFGVDMVALLARELMGEPQPYPGRMLVSGAGAAASVFLIAADSRGNPWRRLPRFDWAGHDWRRLVSPGTKVEIIRSQSRPSGAPMPEYRPNSGAMNSAAEAYVTARDPLTLKDDTYRIIDNLEASLTEGG